MLMLCGFMDRCYRKQTCWKAKSFETERYLGRSDFPSPQCSRIYRACAVTCNGLSEYAHCRRSSQKRTAPGWFDTSWFLLSIYDGHARSFRNHDSYQNVSITMAPREKLSAWATLLTVPELNVHQALKHLCEVYINMNFLIFIIYCDNNEQ